MISSATNLSNWCKSACKNSVSNRKLFCKEEQEENVMWARTTPEKFLSAADFAGMFSKRFNLVVLPDDPRRVIVQKLALVVEGRPDEELDLTIGLDEIKKTVRPFFISPTVHHDDTKSWKLRHYLFIQSYISGQPTSRINYCIVKQS